MLLRLGTALVLSLALALPAAADSPGSDGGPAERGCGSLGRISSFGPVGVGATDASCKVAREVARDSVRGRSVDGWRCTGRKTRFGHCHGVGSRRGSVVHWYADH